MWVNLVINEVDVRDKLLLLIHYGSNELTQEFEVISVENTIFSFQLRKINDIYVDEEFQQVFFKKIESIAFTGFKKWVNNEN